MLGLDPPRPGNDACKVKTRDGQPLGKGHTNQQWCPVSAIHGISTRLYEIQVETMNMKNKRRGSIAFAFAFFRPKPEFYWLIAYVIDRGIARPIFRREDSDIPKFSLFCSMNWAW